MYKTHGRTQREWQDLIAETKKFLALKARRGRLTNYTELNGALAGRTGQDPFDFKNPDDRSAMGDLLGDVVEATYHRTDHPFMLSALVTFLDEMRPGQGFFDLAVHMGFPLRDADREAMEDFWVEQTKLAFSHYAR